MPKRSHGMTRQADGRRTPTYLVWQTMLCRCRNTRAPNYQNYGARGIHVCERWYKFENFLKDMGIRPDGMTIDRIDNAGHYEPGNCRWVTRKVNCRNRRDNRLLAHAGETKTLAEWKETTKLGTTLQSRMQIGWDPVRALTMPKRPHQRWTIYERRVLKRHYQRLGGPRKCAHILSHRSLQSINTAACKLGLSDPRGTRR